MYLHPVHFSKHPRSGSVDLALQHVARHGVDLANTFLVAGSALQQQQRETTDVEVKPWPIEVYSAQSQDPTIVPCFFVIQDSNHQQQSETSTKEKRVLSNGTSEIAGDIYGVSYRFYYPFVLLYLSRTALALLLGEEQELPSKLLTDYVRETVITYVFKRYVELYVNMREKPFYGVATKPYVPRDDRGTDSLTPSSIGDAEARLQELLKRAQPLLAHFFPFLPRQHGRVIPGQLQEVLSDSGGVRDITSIPFDLSTLSDQMLVHHIPLRKDNSGEFIPINSSMFAFAYGIMRLLCHQGDPDTIMTAISHARSRRRGSVNKVDFGPYQRLFRVFLTYLCEEKDKELEEWFGERLPRLRFKRTTSSSLVDVSRSAAHIGTMVHIAATEAKEMPEDLHRSLFQCGQNCDIEAIQAALEASSERLESGSFSAHLIREAIEELTA